MAGQAAQKDGERQGDFVGGKYLLEECLGIGGMGEVYRATNVSLGRKVAIKLLNKEHTSNEDDVLRFLREARAAAAVRHPNVVDVFDVARDDDGTPFIVQELLSGEDLEQYLGFRPDGKVGASEALEIMIPVAEAVAAAHARDVVHRDLKPANIFLAREGNKIIPKVLDFGACLYQTVGALSAKERRMLIGTPHYMAPEQITTAKDVDLRADVWAMGVIFFEMLSGNTPFEAADANAVMKLVRTRAVPKLRKVAPEAPERLEELVERCLDRDRKKRFANASEVREELDQIRKELAKGARKNRSVDTLTEPDEELPPARNAPKLAAGAAKPAPAKAPVGRIDLRKEEEAAANTRVPSLVLKGAKQTKRRGSSLLTLSSPDEEVSWDDTPPSASRPIEAAKPVSAKPAGSPVSAKPSRTAADVIRDAEEASGIKPTAKSRPPPPAPRDLDFDLDEGAGQALDLDLGKSAPLSPRRSNDSSIPPVLEPRSAAASSPADGSAKPRAAAASSPEPSALTPPLASPASFRPPRLSAASAPTSGEVARPRANVSGTASASSAAAPSWTPSSNAVFALAVVAPAFAAFLVLDQLPFVTAPLGHAMRGDSPLASGMLAVVALVGAAVLAAKALGSSRSKAMVVATVGAVLLGIVMIIVTFAASETAELGITPAVAGVVPLLAPLVPLALGFAAVTRARSAWLSRYERRDKVLFVVLASLMLLTAVELGPVGAVRGVAPASRAVHTP